MLPGRPLIRYVCLTMGVIVGSDQIMSWMGSLHSAKRIIMRRNYRISSPEVFKQVLSKSKIFRKHDWLFDIHPGLVSGFRPDIRVSFDSDDAFGSNQFGHLAKISRHLIAPPNFGSSSDGWSLAELETQTYVTMSHGDDAFLSVAASDGALARLRPSRVFRGNDVRAAELAVKLNIGYSALPEFMAEDHTPKPGSHGTFFAGWQVSPTFLRIASSGPPDIHLSKIHEALLNALTPLVNSSWRSFGQTQNIVPLVSSK